MRLACCLPFLLAYVGLAECVLVGPRPSGNLEVTAYSALGERIDGAGIQLVDLNTHREIGSRLKNGATERLPYGTYLVRVLTPGFHQAEREIHLDQPEMEVRMIASVAIECGTYPRVKGTVHFGVVHKGELWVKLTPLQGVLGAEARVKPDGSFSIGGLEDGRYIFMVLDGDTVLTSATHVIAAGDTVSIDLAER